MKMKLDICSGLLAGFLGFTFVSTAMARDVLAPGAASAPVAIAASDWRSLIGELSAHPEVLTKDWAAMRAALPAGCFRNSNKRDLDCPPMDGVVRVSVDPGPQGIIDLVLKAPATCDQIYDLLSKRFGKGEMENGDKCYAEWKLKKWVKRANVNLAPGRRDPTQLRLQFAVEQGP